MGKTSSKVKDRYNLKAYDSFLVRVPKGQKATIEEAAKKEGESINGFAKKAFLARMGLKEWPETKEE
ncbi:antitoxin [Eubacteriales bacterium OttesenSCG-928-A19]|nr:antitoxin [Eubacteriales bacterium OttesenSCG-928-A19]